MSYMERFFRGFMGIVKDLEGENASRPSPRPTAPDACTICTVNLRRATCGAACLIAA